MRKKPALVLAEQTPQEFSPAASFLCVLVSGRQRGGRLLGSNALSVARQLWSTKPCGKEWVNPAGGDLDSEIFPNSLWLVAGYGSHNSLA